MRDTSDLTLEKTLRCPADAAFKCWTSPEFLRRFLAAPGERLLEATLDPVLGGQLLIRRFGLDGVEVRVEGCVLHVVPGRRLMWTDMLSAGFRPRKGGSFTADLTFMPTDRGQCDFRIILRHDPEAPPSRDRLREIEARWQVISDQLARLVSGI